MTEREDLFLSTLAKNFPDIYEIARKKKYKLLVPLKRCIIETMLNRNFYDNHIYAVSKYDENMYVNLNGRVLKLDNQKFTSFLGWKKDMEFAIKEEFIIDQELSCILIDNVCDDANYNRATISVKDSSNKGNYIKRYTNMEDYIKNYTVNTFNDNDFEKAYESYDYATDILRNNKVFMKYHEDEYAVYFNQEIRMIQENFKMALSKWKPNVSVDLIVAELVDSLVFNKMYDFIFDSLVEFHKEEEEEMKAKMKEFPEKYEISSMQLDKAYRSCKFEKAVNLLKEISNKKNVFEKLVSLFLIRFS